MEEVATKYFGFSMDEQLKVYFELCEISTRYISDTFFSLKHT